MEKRAVVTIAIGNIPYFQYTKKLQEIYARNCNADYVVINESSLNNKPHYEKWRCSNLLDQYDRILYLDADVMPTSNAPNIFEQHPNGFWAVHELVEGRSEKFCKRMEIDFKILAEMYGQADWDGRYFNSGVMLFGNESFNMFSDLPHVISGDIAFNDQTRLNYLLKRHGIKFNELDPKWNAIEFLRNLLKIDINKAYFIHFIKGTRKTLLMEEIYKKQREIYNARITDK